jgi:hypothetical protein
MLLEAKGDYAGARTIYEQLLKEDECNVVSSLVSMSALGESIIFKVFVCHSRRINE